MHNDVCTTPMSALCTDNVQQRGIPQDREERRGGDRQDPSLAFIHATR